MLGKYVKLKSYFEIEEAKYEEQGVQPPFHVRDAMNIIRER